jgi:hypothetical protein
MLDFIMIAAPKICNPEIKINTFWAKTTIVMDMEQYVINFMLIK